MKNELKSIIHLTLAEANILTPATNHSLSESELLIRNAISIIEGLGKKVPLGFNGSHDDRKGNKGRL
jgi:hypothetical protein